MPGARPSAGLDPKTANVRYHDAAARTYEDKWGLAFDARTLAYVTERARRMLPARGYGRVLEVGSGTGFFLLNLWRGGFAREPHATDISPGMLEVCAERARQLGCDLRVRTADAERLPYPDGTFDLVVGHAFLHHVPDPRASLREMRRVLRPGGAVFIAGEPTRAGDRIAGVVKRAASAGFRAADALVGGLRRRPAEPSSEAERVMRDLEFAVDLHTFEPQEVAGWAREAGFGALRIDTEELTASVLGWAVRTIESQARPGLLGAPWAAFAYGGWRALSRLDRALAAVVPRRLFYNLLLYGERED